MLSKIAFRESLYPEHWRDQAKHLIAYWMQRGYTDAEQDGELATVKEIERSIHAAIPDSFNMRDDRIRASYEDLLNELEDQYDAGVKFSDDSTVHAAGLARKIVRVANGLDDMGLHREASVVDGIMRKVAEGLNDDYEGILADGAEHEVWSGLGDRGCT